MLLLTSLLTVLALCMLPAHASFTYNYASPSRSPNDTAYTVIEVPIAPHITSAPHIARQSGFFHHSPTPSASVTPIPLAPTAAVIAPYTQLPTKTPTPLALVNRAVNHTDISALPSSNISAHPTPQVQSVPVVTAPALFVPLESQPAYTSSPPLTKRIIAIPLRVPRRQPPSYIMPSPTMSSPFPSVYQVEPMPYDTQRELFVPQRQPPSHITASPSTSAYKTALVQQHIQHEVLVPHTSPTPVYPLPSLLVSVAHTSPTPNRSSAPPAVHSVHRAYHIRTTIPPEADVVAPLSPLPSASMKIIPLNIRLKKRIHASPLVMPSATPYPPQQQPGPSADMMRMVGPGFILGNTFENNGQHTVEPVSTQISASPSCTPTFSSTHLYTVTPSVVPSVGPTDAVRMASRRRVPSVKTKSETAPIAPSPSSTPSTTPSKLMLQDAKMLNRHRVPVRKLFSHRLPSLKVRKEAAPETVASPTSTPSVAPKPMMQDVKMLKRHRIPVRTLFDHHLPSLKVKKEAAFDAMPSPTSTPSISPSKRMVQDVKMLNRHRIPVRRLYRHRLPPLKVRKELVSRSSTSDYTQENSDVDRGTVTQTPTPSKAAFVYGAKMARLHRIPTVNAKKQATRQLGRNQMTTIDTTGGSFSPSVYNITIGPTPSVSMNVHTAYSTPVMIKSSVQPSPSNAPDMHEDSARISMDLAKSTEALDNLSPSLEEDDYCESVKQCMCAVIDDNLLSTELLSYCNHLNELNYSFCEQSKEAHIFLQFWTNKNGAKTEEGMALLNECNLSDIKALL